MTNPSLEERSGITCEGVYFRKYTKYFFTGDVRLLFQALQMQGNTIFIAITT